MPRLRPCYVLAFTLVLTPLLCAADKPTAADKPASPWSIDQSLSIAPSPRRRQR